jgi:hypothetical protein
MNSNGFTKRNVFIGDVQITEDLSCGDMVCQEMTLTGDINLDNKDIVGVNNLEVKTVNGGAILTNPLTSDLDCDGKNILNVGDLEVTTINNRSVLYTPSIGNLNMNNFNINNVNNINATTLNSKTPFYQTTTVDLDMNNNAINNVSIVNFPTGQYIDGQDGSALDLYTEGDITLACSQVVIGDNPTTNYTLPTVRGADSSIMTLGMDGASSWSDTLVNQVGTNSSNITTLQTKTQYQSVVIPSQTTLFTGIVNATTTLAVGVAQSGQTGYNFPLSRPLVAGYTLVTPASTGNTLSFQIAADPNKILNQTSISGVSTTFNGQIIVGNTGVRYTFPNTRGTDGQYLKTDGSGILSWTSFSQTYAQIARQLTETAGYLVLANSLYTAQLLGNTVDTTLSNSADVTVDLVNGSLTYTGPPRVLTVEVSLRARTSDNKSLNGVFSLYLLAGTPAVTVSRDNARFETVQDRRYFSCKAVNLFPTNTLFTFAISYDISLTNTLFLSSISLNIYGVGT